MMEFQSATNAIEHCGGMGMLLTLAPRSHVTSSNPQTVNFLMRRFWRRSESAVYFEAAFSMQPTQPT
jgi:hypothetical protein